MHCLPADHQRDLDQLPAYYWWHRRRIETVIDSVGRFLKPKPGQYFHYLDVGAGTGATTQVIADELRSQFGVTLHAQDIVCLDGDSSLSRFQESKEHTFRVLDLDKDWDIQRGGFELVTLLDVLEHVDDPVHLLRCLKRQIATGGIGVITVPAFNFLFSQWDRTLGHKKRYITKFLREECRQAGLNIVWSSYLFSHMLPPAFLKRLFFSRKNVESEFPRVPSLLNGLLRGMGFIEGRITRVVPIPFGTSIAVVVRPSAS